MVGLYTEHLLAHERREQPLQLGFGNTGERSQRLFREGLAEHRRVLEQPPLLWIEPVQPSRDQSLQRLGNLQFVDRPGLTVDRSLLDQESAVEQHPHRFDRVQRDAFGTPQDLLPKLERKAGYEAVEEGLHVLGRERLEKERRLVSRAAAEPRMPLLQLRAGVTENVDRVVARPLEDVGDELDQR